MHFFAACPVRKSKARHVSSNRQGQDEHFVTNEQRHNPYEVKAKERPTHPAAANVYLEALACIERHAF